MNLTSTTSQPHSSIDQLAGRTQGLRGSGAEHAQGFAQIMQAFTDEPEALDTQTIHAADEQGKAKDQAEGLKDEPDNQTQESEEKPQASQTQSQTQSQPQSQNDTTQTQESQDPNQDNATRSADAVEGVDPPRQPNEAVGQNAQTTGAADGTDATGDTQEPGLDREASLRLLSKQSEQAKLSIKGLVRSLTHAAGADLTAISVDTRLGKMDDSPHTPTDPMPNPDQARPDRPHPPQQQPIAHADKPAPGVQSTDVPDSPRDPAGPVLRQPIATPAPTRAPLIDQPDQARTDVQQARSARADASATVQGAARNARPDLTRLAQIESAGQTARITREGAAQSVRAVTGIESAQAGDPFKGSSSAPGSLVEKMTRPAVPQGSDRAALMAQVQRGMASLLRSGRGDMTIKLIPANLGEVRIRIKSQGDRLSVRFETSTDRADKLLNESVKDLTTHLRSKGVQLGHLSIEHRDAGSPASTPATANADAGHAGAHDQQTGHQQRGDAPHPQADGQASRPAGADPSLFDEPDINQPAAIWTQLGLDAVA